MTEVEKIDGGRRKIDRGRRKINGGRKIDGGRKNQWRSKNRRVYSTVVAAMPEGAPARHSRSNRLSDSNEGSCYYTITTTDIKSQ